MASCLRERGFERHKMDERTKRPLIHFVPVLEKCRNSSEHQELPIDLLEIMF